MSEALRDDDRMRIEAFHALFDDRPHWEKWELIDGKASMQATPAKRHQIVAANVLFHLETIRRSTGAPWRGIAGIGTRIPGDDHNEIVPDVMILPPGDDLSNWTYEILVAFEVLSPGSVRRDMMHKRAIYRRMPRLTHYIVLAQDRREATVFARDEDFAPRKLTSGTIELEQLGVRLPLEELYRDVQLD
jgi:Uma2 family endonuclease